MIVYQSSKLGFCDDVAAGDIDQLILERMRGTLGRGVGVSEVRSWHQSLTHMHLVLTDAEIPDDAGVGIEYQIPQTAKRIDVLLSGQSDEEHDQAVIIELKQWETAEPTPMDGIVRDNQIKELIHAADVTVFFLDEDQRVTLQDIGTRDEILEWAAHFDADVEEMELLSQFRCNGSIGCIHTCQGLELDYIGVIIGEDLVVRDGRLVTQPDERSRHDQSIRGYKTWRRRDREAADAAARMIILNTYRALMTRGLKGCYVWVVDEGVREWLRRSGVPL